MAVNKIFIACVAIVFMINFVETKKCHNRCQKAPWHIAGKCIEETGRCRCYYGWTGPNSRYLPGSRNIIEADYCTEACHYTHDHKNPKCTYSVPEFIKPSPQRPVKRCSVLCGHFIYSHTGKCMNDIPAMKDNMKDEEMGKCLCWWGWTGPGAEYRDDGQVMAQYCVLPCDYNEEKMNPVCAMTKKDKAEMMKKMGPDVNILRR